MNWKAQETLVHRLVNKIRLHADEIVRYEEEDTQDAEVVVVSYGITARVARRGVELARREGIKVGILRLVIVWPFPERRVFEIASTVPALVVPELNYGQVVREVERAAKGRANVVLVPHGGGEVHDPGVIADAIVRPAGHGR